MTFDIDDVSLRYTCCVLPDAAVGVRVPWDALKERVHSSPARFSNFHFWCISYVLT